MFSWGSDLQAKVTRLQQEIDTLKMRLDRHDARLNCAQGRHEWGLRTPDSFLPHVRSYYPHPIIVCKNCGAISPNPTTESTKPNQPKKKRN